MPVVADDVRKIIADHLDRNVEEVRDEASFVGDLGADSLDAVELHLALEDSFEIEIPDEAAEKMVTVADVISYIQQTTWATPS